MKEGFERTKLIFFTSFYKFSLLFFFLLASAGWHVVGFVLQSFVCGVYVLDKRFLSFVAAGKISVRENK